MIDPNRGGHIGCCRYANPFATNAVWPHKDTVSGPVFGTHRGLTLPVLQTKTPDLRGFWKRMMGLEPTTFCMASRRSSQLSYIRATASIALVFGYP